MSEKLGRQTATLVAAGAITTGSTIRLRSGDGCRINVVGAGGAVGTVQCEGSADEVNWYDLGPALVFAANDVQSLWLPEPNTAVRANVTAWTSGTFDAAVQIYG